MYFCWKNVGSWYAIFNDQSFNNMLTNDIVSFEQLGPELFIRFNTHLFQKSAFFTATPFQICDNNSSRPSSLINLIITPLPWL